MTDIFTTEKRSQIMSRIGGKNTKPELIVRRYLFAQGFRYRLHGSSTGGKKLAGKPDIVPSKYRAVVFVQGCFWHGHSDCPSFKLPKSRVEFWTNKIRTNIERDASNRFKLAQAGWHVVTVWECHLKKVAVRETTLVNLAAAIRQRTVLDDPEQTVRRAA